MGFRYGFSWPGLALDARPGVSPLLLVCLLAAVPALGNAAAEWRYSVGAHDFSVPDVDSHTYGINTSILVDQHSDTGPHLFGSFELLLDHDTDHLDPDHVPLWSQVLATADSDFWREGQLHFGWGAEFRGRVNTVSSVERQFTALPALVAGYDGDRFQASAEAGAGWFMLELDDDAPRQRGYGRTGLRNSTLAYALTGKAGLKLGEFWAASGLARYWQDGDQSLEEQYTLELRGDVGHWIDGHAGKGTELVISSDFYKYNLDMYNQANALPVLGWNDDVMFKVALESKW